MKYTRRRLHILFGVHPESAPIASAAWPVAVIFAKSDLTAGFGELFVPDSRLDDGTSRPLHAKPIAIVNTPSPRFGT